MACVIIFPCVLSKKVAQSKEEKQKFSGRSINSIFSFNQIPYLGPLKHD